MDGYKLFRSTFSLINVSTQVAMANQQVKKSTFTAISISTNLAAGVTYFYRLTAYDTSANQSGFNIDTNNQPHQLVVYIKVGDVNRDSKVNLTDLSLLLSRWLSNNPDADFDNNGTVNLTDLSRLLANWGA